MKLKIEYINEETDEVFIVKNEGDEVWFHSSDVHDSDEFEGMSNQLFRGNAEQRRVIDSFYKLAMDILS